MSLKGNSKILISPVICVLSIPFHCFRQTLREVDLLRPPKGFQGLGANVVAKVIERAVSHKHHVLLPLILGDVELFQKHVQHLHVGELLVRADVVDFADLAFGQDDFERLRDVRNVQKTASVAAVAMNSARSPLQSRTTILH